MEEREEEHTAVHWGEEVEQARRRSIFDLWEEEEGEEREEEENQWGRSMRRSSLMVEALYNMVEESEDEEEEMEAFMEELEKERRRRKKIARFSGGVWVDEFHESYSTNVTPHMPWHHIHSALYQPL